MARGTDATQHRPMADADEGLAADRVLAMRGERIALSATSFTAPPGAAIVVTGANGAGKSTLLRVLAGLISTDAGAVRWHGHDIRSDRAAHGRRVAYLGHLDALKPALTPFETLRLWCDSARAETELTRAGLWQLAELPVRHLSAGQRRRLAIARLAVRDAPVWLLDEPTVGLDTDAVERFGHLLAHHRQAGGIVIAATHLPLPLPDATDLALGT